jgi:hypothetical protein
MGAALVGRRNTRRRPPRLYHLEKAVSGFPRIPGGIRQLRRQAACSALMSGTVPQSAKRHAEDSNTMRRATGAPNPCPRGRGPTDVVCRDSKSAYHIDADGRVKVPRALRPHPVAFLLGRPARRGQADDAVWRWLDGGSLDSGPPREHNVAGGQRCRSPSSWLVPPFAPVPPPLRLVPEAPF